MPIIKLACFSAYTNSIVHFLINLHLYKERDYGNAGSKTVHGHLYFFIKQPTAAVYGYVSATDIFVYFHNDGEAIVCSSNKMLFYVTDFPKCSVNIEFTLKKIVLKTTNGSCLYLNLSFKLVMAGSTMS